MVSEALSDVTLTMIVRDELMNPAGGLLPMLEYHLPHFPEAVVLDTGSVDGTRQLLEHLQGQYPQLKVYDAKFNGYGFARIEANQHVSTEYSFMLDADERLEKPRKLYREWNRILARAGEASGINFDFEDITLNGDKTSGYGWNPRLLKKRMVDFRNLRLWECSTKECDSGIPHGTVTILHFRGLPNRTHDLHHPKTTDWYRPLSTHLERGEAPSQLPNFHIWKTPNSIVLQQYGVNVFEVLKRLEDLGLPPHHKIVERLEKQVKK